MSHAPFFHPDSGTVRFWVSIGERFIGATIGCDTLNGRFGEGAATADPLSTYKANTADLHAAVRRHMAMGAHEPVSLGVVDLMARPRI